MRTVILGGIGIVVGILAGTAVLSTESAQAQYSTQKGNNWIAKSIRSQKGTAEKRLPKMQTKSK
jgi:hypothetical protein